VADCSAPSCAIPLTELDPPDLFCPTHWRMLPAEIRGPLQTEPGRDLALGLALVRIAAVSTVQSMHESRLVF
jgi:hypothetical protein